MKRNDDISHRHCSIRHMRVGSGFQARAFRGRKAVGEALCGETRDAAVQAVIKFLDGRALAMRAKRGKDGFPCADEVREALACISMNRAQEAMLTAHLHAPEHTLTATQLAEAADYESYEVANRQYGQLAFDLACELDWTPEEKTNGITTWTFTLADDADKQDRADGRAIVGHWRWKLRQEVVEALS